MPESNPTTVSCPQCGVELNIPVGAELAQLKCPQCQGYLKGAVGSESPQATGPLPPHLQPKNDEPATTRPPSAPSGFNIKLDESHQRNVRTGKRGWGSVWLILSAISLMVLSFLAVASLAVRLLMPDLFVPEQIADRVDVKVVRGTYQPPKAWTPALNKSLRVGGLKIKIERIEIGPVLAKDGSQEIIASDAENMMQIYLSVENETDEPIEYTSWYGNEFVVGTETVSAKLKDETGELYSMLVFEDVTGVFGHLPRATIHGKETIQDSIVFEVPPDQKEPSGPWRLELPQAAFGLPGSMGFELTDELVKTESRLGSSPLDGPTSDDDN